MDPRHTAEMLKHLEKQNELLKDAYDSMSQELHKLQVEEEMLMRKFYELMASHVLTKKYEASSIDFGGQNGHSTALLTNTSMVSDGNENGHSTEFVPAHEHQ